MYFFEVTEKKLNKCEVAQCALYAIVRKDLYNVVQTSSKECSEYILEQLVTTGLSSPGGAHQHNSVTHLHRLKQLDHLRDIVLKVCFLDMLVILIGNV